MSGVCPAAAARLEDRVEGTLHLRAFAAVHQLGQLDQKRVLIPVEQPDAKRDLVGELLVKHFGTAFHRQAAHRS